MSAIWLLSTRDRPNQAQETIDACQAAGMTARGVVYIDQDTGLYEGLRLPHNWTVHREPRWLSLQGSMSWCLREYPDATAYGWLADDVRPRTEGWDTALEQAAGRWNLSYAKDLWFSEDPIEEHRLYAGKNLSSGLCWGGDLVRAVGWWALPGVIQGGIDTAWTDLITPLDLHRYLPDVVVEHLNWRTGKRPQDQVDDWTRDGDNYIDRDLVVKQQWRQSQNYRDLLTVIAESIRLNATSPPLVYALALSEADEHMHRTGVLKERTVLKLHGLERAANEHQRHNADQEQAPVDPSVPPVGPEPDV